MSQQESIEAELREIFASADNLLAAYARAAGRDTSSAPSRRARQVRTLLAGLNASPEFKHTLIQEAELADRAAIQSLARRRKGVSRHGKRHGNRWSEEKLDRELLNRLTPEVFADVVRLEARQGAGWITYKVMVAAGLSDENALRVSNLLIQATLFGKRQERHDASEERIYGILFTGWTPYAIFSSKEEEAQFFHCLFARLIAMAQMGNQAAHRRLRLFWRAVQRFGYELDPVPTALWDGELAQQALKAGSTPPDPSKHIQMPIPCEPKEFPVIRRVVDAERAALAESAKIQEELSAQIRGIRYSELLYCLDALWTYIAEVKERRILRAEGGDKVDVAVPVFCVNAGLRAFAFFREEQSFPGVGIHLYTDILGYRDVYRMAFTPDGDIEGANPSWPNWYQALLCLMLLDAYAQIVVKIGEESSVRRSRRTVRRREDRSWVQPLQHVRPFFRSLPAGWYASAEAIAHAQQIAGEPPPEGMTFVGEFDRNYPEFVSAQARAARDEWSRQANARATFVYRAENLEEILAGLR